MDIHYGAYTNPDYEFKAHLDPQPFRNTQQYWRDRLDQLNEEFKIAGEVEKLDRPDRLILRNKNKHRNLHVYKGSQSFLYFDEHLASPTDPIFAEKLLPEVVAAKKARAQLHALGLLDEYTQLLGIGYTGVSVDDSTPENPYSPSEEYKTEIKVHYRFQLGGLPVFGPGAKIIVCYAGEELSQLLYFWRTPSLLQEGPFTSSKVALDRPLISPQEALDYFCHDNRFTKLKSGQAKVRFHDLQLGYYARSPQYVQRFLYPVYQVSGTIETWQMNENGFSGIQEHLSGDVFRQDFTLYMLAVSDPNLAEKKLHGYSGKAVTIF